MNVPCPSQEQPLLQISGAVVLRDGREILRVEHLRLLAGEHVAVLGPNGAGKSTLIGLLTREVRPVVREDGLPSVLLQGRERWNLFEARNMLGVVSDALQNDHRRAVTLADVVTSGFFGSVGLYRRGEVTQDHRAKVAEVLRFLDIEDLADRRLDTLSTGEARRALIGRALVHDPAVLALDEPMHGLDPRGVHEFRRLLGRLADAGRTLLLVTHHVEDIIPQIERVVMLKAGRIVQDGPKTSLLTSREMSGLFGFPAHVECREGIYRLW